MWRSDDAGKTWVKTTLPGDLPSTTCLIQDPRRNFSNVWYFGTGEFGGGLSSGITDVSAAIQYQGKGIYKSTDGGNSWSLLASTVSEPTIYGGGTGLAQVGEPALGGDFAYVWNIVINPTNGDLYAATYSGIMRSTDGGISWTKVLGVLINRPAFMQTDIAISSRGWLYATIASNGAPNPGFYASNDGVNWQNQTQAVLSAFQVAPTAYSRVVIHSSEF